MGESGGLSRSIRNLGVYLIGVGLAVIGALGLSAAIELSTAIALLAFIAGLAIVVLVHEYLGGPI